MVFERCSFQHTIVGLIATVLILPVLILPVLILPVLILPVLILPVTARADGPFVHEAVDVATEVRSNQKQQPDETRDAADGTKASTSSVTNTSVTNTQKMEEVAEFARETHDRMQREIQDYSCQIVKRARSNGKLSPYQHMEVKIRHEQKEGDKIVVPFSVFIRFLGPEQFRGREVLFIRGENDDCAIVRVGGESNPNMTLELETDSPLAMKGNRYPITDIGMLNLARLLIQVLEEELEADRGQVAIRNAKLYGRECKHFRLFHSEEYPDARYKSAEVLVDTELKVPVYYRAFDWPYREGGKPVLLEEYAYRDIKFNVGLTDKDFDRENPDYHFRNRSETLTEDEALEHVEKAKTEEKEVGKDAKKKDGA